jgi:hypothetical protein
MIGDPFLNDFALGIIFFVVIVLCYGINAIDDIQGSGSHTSGAMIVRSVGQPRAAHSKCLSKIAHSEPAVVAAWDSSW